jgi:drug/metabolite transporter (DMT)-like permease
VGNLDVGARPGSKWDTTESSPARPPAHKVDLRAYVYVALMIVLGSMTAPAARYAVRELPVALVPVLRFAMAGLCLLPVVWGSPQFGRMLRRDPWLLILSAAMCVPINQGFFLSAARLGPTSHVGIFYATCPLVVLLLAWAMRLERPDAGRLWGVLASVAGIVVIGVGNYWTGGSGTGHDVRSVVLADCLLVGAVISWGTYMAVSKPLVERHGAMPALAGTFLLGSLMSAPVALLSGPSLGQLGQASTTAWVALLLLGFFITPFGWAFQNLALSRFEASQVATFSNGSPMLTVVWGIVLFGEALTPTLLLGGALTLGGIYWASRPKPNLATIYQGDARIAEPLSLDLPSPRPNVAAALAIAEESVA